MFHCYYCAKAFLKADDLVQHIRKEHELKNGDRWNCGEHKCHRVFQTPSNFITHLLTHSYGDIVSRPKNNNKFDNRNPNDYLIRLKKQFYEEKSSIRHSLHDAGRAFTVDAHKRPLTRQDVQGVVEAADALVKATLSPLKNFFNNYFYNPEGEKEKQILEDIFTFFSGPLDKYSSEHLRIKDFKDTDFYVSPKSYVVGQTEVSKIQNQIFKLIQENVSGQFVSIKETIKKLFSVPGFYETVYQFMKGLIEDKSSNISHFIQADLYKPYRDQFPEKLILPLFIFYDEFETNNPLGPKAGVHNIGATYFSLMCLPPEYVSKLENIFLTLLLNKEARKEYGNENAFKPLLDELLELESTPIFVKDGNEVFVQAFIVSGDNLGVHEVLGFVEGFTANFPCRICKISKEEMWNLCFEDKTVLRSTETYETDVKLNNVSETGIKYPCVFNKLKNYHCIKNSSCDIMHDVYEGACRYIMSKLILYYISDEKGIFTLSELNDRIGTYNFGTTDKGNRPSFLTEKKLKNKTLGLSASETYTFVKHFGLLVGDLVDEGDPHWEIYKKLCELISFLDKRSFTRESVDELRLIISSLNTLYIDLFGANLMFKLHFLLHYPDLMLKLGPLKPLSSMRGEAKHKVLKGTARRTNCRINLEKTLAIDHQIKMCCRFIEDIAFEDKIEFGATDRLKIDESPFYDDFQNIINSYKLVKTLTIKGIKYEKKLLINYETIDLPAFGQIECILYDFPNESSALDVIFIVRDVDVIEFDEHYQAFGAKKLNSYTAISYTQIENKFCSDLLFSYNRHRYIIKKE